MAHHISQGDGIVHLIIVKFQLRQISANWLVEAEEAVFFQQAYEAAGEGLCAGADREEGMRGNGPR
jgi:hypothetical protein